MADNGNSKDKNKTDAEEHKGTIRGCMKVEKSESGETRFEGEYVMVKQRSYDASRQAKRRKTDLEKGIKDVLVRVPVASAERVKNFARQELDAYLAKIGDSDAIARPKPRSRKGKSKAGENQSEMYLVT